LNFSSTFIILTKQFLIIIKRSAMKKIEAIIRRSKYSDVKEALHQAGVNFFSYWDVTGIGNEQRGHVYRGISYSTSEIQRRFLSIVVNDDFVQPTIDAILKSGATDKVGDGKIFILPAEEAYRIRTGDKGTDSLN
jgi:nitrogen regulatory protein P-II 1